MSLRIQSDWGAKTLSYDANGNLTGDGTNTYTWNTRNQLMNIAGGSTGSFVYDALGRRESKTISGTATNFLYDGLNMEQELSGTTPTANYLTGAGIDEAFSRTDSTGSYSYLTDNLGSSLALTNSSGAVSTSYTYEPYGNTTQTGSASTNALQYTGRENDGTGLYFYRARYYSPVYGRFINEDPLGLMAGVNEYSYVDASPTNLRDAFGLDPWFGFSRQDLQAMQAQAEADSAEQQYEAAQYAALQLQAEAAQCIAMQFISEFSSEFNKNSNPFQRQFGAVELLTNGHKLAEHATAAAGLKLTAVIATAAAQDPAIAPIVGRSLEGLGVFAEWGSGAGEYALAAGTYSDLVDAAYTASDMYYFKSNSCCNH